MHLANSIFRPRQFVVGALALLVAGTAFEALAHSKPRLRGSRASMDRQAEQARAHDYTYLRDPAQVRYFVNKGWLVRVRPNSHLRLVDVSFPYARPEVRTFVYRLSAQYHSACGERLVVTSLTRPRSHQPRNASSRSVHPTGMALDLRRPKNSRCRGWLEGVLLSLEERHVLEATIEWRPPHYHVALFPDPYMRYVARLEADTSTRSYKVAAGDNLWEIARRHGVSIGAIKRANNLSSNRIYPGQVLRIPGSGSVSTAR